MNIQRKDHLLALDASCSVLTAGRRAELEDSGTRVGTFVRALYHRPRGCHTHYDNHQAPS